MVNFSNGTAPKSVAHNCHFTVKITSKLNIERWQSAWYKIIQKHFLLRTTFKTLNGKPIQVVDPNINIPLNIIDASNWSEESLRKKLVSIYNTVFDLENEPLIKVYLFQFSVSEFIQVFVFHHLIGDMWSADVLFADLERFYNGDDNRQAYQYQDFVKWQSEIVNSARGKKLWQYWQQELSGQLPILDLPTDKPRPKILNYCGDAYTFELDQNLIEKLKQIQKKKGSRIYNVLLAAYFILLFRYTNQEDILIGTSMVGRSAKKWFKEIFGYFTDPVVLRGKLSGDISFNEFLTQVNRKVYSALRYHDYPFSLLTKQLEVEPDSSRNPLFQACFVWQTHHWYKKVQKLKQEGAQTMEIEPDYQEFGVQRPGMFDLCLQVQEVGDSLFLHWQYNTDLFNLDTIVRMAKHYHVLLSAIISNPETKIGHLPILTEKEKHQLLVDWNNSQVDSPEDKCIHQLFEEQVEKTPDQIAVTFEEKQLTYRELNEKSNQLAYYLRKQGIKPETLVGICLDRSLEMIIGLLGILKAGGAYVPVDPNSPTERLKFIIEDANIDILLTQKSLLNQLPSQVKNLICLDEENLVEEEDKGNPVSQIKPDNLIYIIYTSGSTGKPKGVEITHHNVASRFNSTQAYYQFSAQDKWTLFHSFAFDFAVWEIWGALIYGGSLIIVPYEVRRSPEEFYQLLQKEKITVLNQTPSAFSQLLESINQQKNPHPLDLRLIIFGGEKLNFQILKPWYEYDKSTECQLINMYGITEITIHGTYQPLSETLTNSKHSLIGKPLPDLNIYILDQNLNPVPIGIGGELHICGDGVARGYLNRQELTAEKFIPNPFGKGKLYKTGDLARYLSDGNIEYLGRIDHQVKIRGFRIELGEIEAVLRENSAVQDTVVTVGEDITGNQRLIAYVIPSSNESLTQKELRNFLKQKLPEYMIPNIFVSLEAFPLTANGKVDLRWLPMPDSVRDIEEIEFVAPRDELEEKLVQIWEKMLGIQSISIHDNFFEIGGHSLLTVRLVAEIEKTLNQKLPVAALFQLTTVAQVADVIRQSDSEFRTQKDDTISSNGKSHSVPELPIEDYRALLTTHAHWKSPRLGTKSLVLETQAGNPQQKLPIFAIGGMGDMHHHLPFDQPVYSLPVHTHVKSHDIYIKALAALYVEEILTIQPENPYILFGYCFGGTVALEIAQQLQAQGKQIALLILVERASFDSVYKYYLKTIRPLVSNWRQLLKRDFNEQKTYVIQKAKNVLNKALSKFQPQTKVSPASSTDSPINTNNKFQDNQNFEITYTKDILLAQKNYMPKPYQGKVALYFSYEGARTSWIYPQGGWGNLIKNEIIASEVIPGDTNGLLIEPNVRILADKLIKILDNI